MTKKSAAFFAVFLALSGIVHALDKGKLETHLRKTLSLDTSNKIVVGDPEPSNVSDLIMIPVTIEGGKYPVLMTKDEKKYIWGQVIDFTVDPDEEHWKAIDLTNVNAKGSANAPVTIVEYSDFQCSHCKDAHKVLRKELYKAYTPEQVRWVAKPFPLNGHDWAEAAAIAADCAAQQRPSAYWEMSDYYFDRQTNISTGTFQSSTFEQINRMKLDRSKFQACAGDPASLEKIKAIKVEGLKAGVTSTPTFFINGRLRRGFREFKEIAVVIDEKMAEAKRSAPAKPAR